MHTLIPRQQQNNKMTYITTTHFFQTHVPDSVTYCHVMYKSEGNV
jgi:hypothetical protein